jgi:hypothetical protein
VDAVEQGVKLLREVQRRIGVSNGLKASGISMEAGRSDCNSALPISLTFEYWKLEVETPHASPDLWKP